MAPGEYASRIDEVRHQLEVLHQRAHEAYAATELGIGGTELAGAVRAGRQLVRLAPLRERLVQPRLALTSDVGLAERIRYLFFARTEGRPKTSARQGKGTGTSKDSESRSVAVIVDEDE